MNEIKLGGKVLCKGDKKPLEVVGAKNDLVVVAKKKLWGYTAFRIVSQNDIMPIGEIWGSKNVVETARPLKAEVKREVLLKRKKNKYLSTAERRELKADINSGMSFSEAARKYNVAQSTVSRAYHGAIRTKRRPSGISGEELEKMKWDYFYDKHTIHDLASKYHHSCKTISRELKKGGVILRRQGENSTIA